MSGSGAIWAWGNNVYGQLGIGNNNNVLEPVEISNTSSVNAAAAGQYFSMAVSADGTLWTWGRNNQGQLGVGTTSDSNIPVKVLDNVRAISCGLEHSLALLSDGTLWAWGRNDYGQLGLGNTTTPVTIPTQVTTLSGVSISAIAAGGHHTLVLSDTALYSWGLNETGQLGLGHYTSPITTPTPVAALSGVSISAIGAGAYHSAAILSNHTLRAWGANYVGQLGIGSHIGRYTPQQVLNLSNTVLAISCGFEHSLALLSDGTLWTWGYNNHGQLGNNSTTDATQPIQITAPTNVTAIAGGAYHSLALLSDGTLRTWGDNQYGELGNGLTTESHIPISVNNLGNASTITKSFGEHNLAITSRLIRGIGWLAE